MATLMTTPTSALLTYEAYMAESQVEGRYDIIEGVRFFMPGATFRHQRIAKNLMHLLTAFEDSYGIGLLIPAPYDVLIRRTPKLQTRQPDVLFVSHTRLAQGGGIPINGPLPVAPELVVEIVSDSETERILGDKVADYAHIGVDECWVVRPQPRAVEMLQPGLSGALVVQTYDDTQTLTSRVFPKLSVPVADVFRP